MFAGTSEIVKMEGDRTMIGLTCGVFVCLRPTILHLQSCAGGILTTCKLFTKPQLSGGGVITAVYCGVAHFAVEAGTAGE